MYTLMICSALYLIYTTFAYDLNETYTELNRILITNLNETNESVTVKNLTKQDINDGITVKDNGIEVNEKIIITNSTSLNEIYTEVDEEKKINRNDVDGDEMLNEFITTTNNISLNYSYNYSDYQSIVNFNGTLRNDKDDVNLVINISDFSDDADDDNDTISDDDYLEQIRDFIFPKTWTWVLIFFHSIVFVIGLVGNTLVCVSVYRNHTMRTVTNYFIVNLAVADFLVILFCLPPSVIWDVTMTWFFGIAMCKIVLYLQVR